MKITNIKTYIYKPTWNWLFLKMETDEGVYGWGEATTQAHDKDVEACIHNLADYLIGKDPRDIELHWSTMFRNSYWRPSFVISSAMSGLDMAMWDILGKTLGAPVHRLLGGPVRDRIKVYHNGWWFPAKSTDDYVWLAEREVKEHGAKALKWDPFWGCDVFTSSDEDIRKVIDNVARVRKAVGDDVGLMLDCHSRLTTNGAIRFAHAVADYKPAWFEEPIPTDAAHEDLARVAASTDIPIVTGERVVTRWCFRDIFEKRAAATINPDPCHAGGISEMKKIGEMAHAYYVGFSPHSAGGPVMVAANLHVEACAPNFVIHEFFSIDPPYYKEILKEPFPALKDECLELPERPGLGVDIDEEALSKRPYKYHDMSGFWDDPQVPAGGTLES
ncbi:MAG: galactonate dehydratase [Deltaproteobacteria bacterium]|nr:galactonate dehydratase [Deltaproteobacteria bacterium]MBW2206888.1 galactonate dehydratase [Deltaproteobacteria bacterium]